MELAVLSMNGPSSNLQQLHDAVVSAWTSVPVEGFQHLVEYPKEFRRSGGKREVRASTRWVYLINYYTWEYFAKDLPKKEHLQLISWCFYSLLCPKQKQNIYIRGPNKKHPRAASWGNPDVHIQSLS